jgi:uncharacterized membrane protein YedE/YeeE
LCAYLKKYSIKKAIQKMKILTSPWPWYVAGPLIGLIVPMLFLIGNKTFGISSSLRHACAACVPANIPFFKYEWKKEVWNLFFVSGVFLGGAIAVAFLANPEALIINDNLVKDLATYGIVADNNLVPSDLFSWESLFTIRGFVMIVLGGFLVGFGARYAGGCTSGHAISGISNLQIPSLIATCCFMIGGFVMANIILPFILKL